jgi:hypothetical protein
MRSAKSDTLGTTGKGPTPTQGHLTRLIELQLRSSLLLACALRRGRVGEAAIRKRPYLPAQEVWPYGRPGLACDAWCEACGVGAWPPGM